MPRGVFVRKKKTEAVAEVADSVDVPVEKVETPVTASPIVVGKPRTEAKPEPVFSSAERIKAMIDQSYPNVFRFQADDVSLTINNGFASESFNLSVPDATIMQIAKKMSLRYARPSEELPDIAKAH